MDRKPPLHPKMKKPYQAKINHVVRFDLNISETGGKKGIKTPQKIARGQRERITKKKIQLSQVGGKSPASGEFCCVRSGLYVCFHDICTYTCYAYVLDQIALGL